MKNLHIFFKQIVEGYFISQGHQLTIGQSLLYVSTFKTFSSFQLKRYAPTKVFIVLLSILNLSNTLDK